MNIVTATFSSGCRQVAADEKLWQWDQGQILQIVGLDLPDVYQVEFSNQPVRGTAAPMIGGVDGVEIPDVYLTTGKPVYAFVVLHAGEDDRETEYKITIPVNARPQPTNEQPTPEQQGVIDQLIAALNAGVEKAEDAADEAEGAADDAAAQAQAAAQSASSSASYAGDAAAQAGLAAAAKAGAEAAQAAAELAQGSAEAFATAAGVAKTAAETAQGKAEDAQTAAETAQAAAESAKAVALAAKAAAETAQGKAEGAQEAAEQAAQDAHVEYEQLAGQVTAQGQTIAQHGQAIAQNTADIADLDTELTQQKSAFEDLQDLTNRKAGMLVDTASGAIASFVPDATIPDLLGVSVDIEPVQDLHGQDSPYPAGGGKNIWNPTLVETVSATNPYSVDGDTYTMTWVNVAAAFSTPRNQPFPAGQYTLSVISLNSDAERVRLYIYKASDRSSIGSGASPKTFQAAEPFYVTVGGVYNDPGTAIFKIQLESGSTATSYAPYENICPISGWDSVDIWNKPTHDTTLPPTATIQLGQTIYGAKLTISEDGSVNALIDRAMVDLGTLNWGYSSADVRFYNNSVAYKRPASATEVANAICSQYAITKLGTLNNGTMCLYMNGYIYVKDSRYTDAAAFKTAMSGVQLVYELATPIVIQLDPVTISTISGQPNNLWADAGDVSVVFAADLKNYIDSKIAAAVAAMS